MIKHNEDLFELSGVIHIHTEYSDGSVTYDELKSTAREVNLDYIIVTDHMTLDAKDKGEEGFSKGLFTLVGYEHNDIHKKNHYLAIGCSKVISEQEDVKQYVSAIKKQGGIGFMAHPAEKRNYFKQYPSYPWTDWNIEGIDGIEIWNQMSEWVENLKSYLSFVRIFYPRRFHRGAPKKVLANWDRLNQKKFVSGIGGVDAHTFKHSFLGFKFHVFPLKVELKGIRTYLYLTKNPDKLTFEENKMSLINSLKNGHGYIGYYRRGDAAGTLMKLVDSSGASFLPGKHENIPKLPATFEVTIPDIAEIRLLRNGDLIGMKKAKSVSFDIVEKGLYRIEVKKGKDTWIYSNPFPVGTYPLDNNNE